MNFEARSPGAIAALWNFDPAYDHRRAKAHLRSARAPMMRGRANTERIIMRTFVALLVLIGHCFVSHTAAEAQSQDCKLCRDDYTACVKAHTQGACKTNYDICMNHCRKK